MKRFPTAGRVVLSATVLALAPGLGQAQPGLTVQQKTTFNVARLTSADLQQTISILGADRARTTTTGKVKVLIISSDASGTEIVRLDRDSIIKLDDKKKRYEVKSLADARAELAKQQKDAAKQAQAQEKEDVRYSIVLDEARRTGEKSTSNGFSTEQVLIRLTVIAENTKTGEKVPHLHLIADTWVDPSQQEAARIHGAFQLAQSRALGVDPTMAGNPYARWLTDLRAEMAKIEGYPIRTQLSFELAVDSAAVAAQQQEEQQPAEKPSPLGRGLGGLLGRGAKKEDPAAKGSGRPVLFSSTIEVLSISLTPPSAGEFEIPAGYTKK